MKKVAEFIVKKRIWFTVAFLLVLISSAVCIFFVDINYNDAAYLPDDSDTKTGMEIMSAEFGDGGSASVMVAAPTVVDALKFKERLASVNGVARVIWADDILTSVLAATGAFASSEKDEAAGTSAEGTTAGTTSQETTADGTVAGEVTLVEATTEEATAGTAAGEATARTTAGEATAGGTTESGTNAEEATAGTTIDDAVAVMIKLISSLPDDLTDFKLFLTVITTFSAKEIPVLQDCVAALGGSFVGMTDEAKEALSAFKAQLDGFYKDGYALFTVLFTESDYSQSTYLAMKNILSMGDVSVSGNSALVYLGQTGSTKQVLICSLCVVAIAVVILFLTSSSFFEPVLYILSIGVAIVINMGSNIIFQGGISYLTNSVSCILQLALSIDYSIFLLTRFKKERAEGLEAEQAMINALAKSMSPVSASSLTTLASFVALLFMKYKMGMDMGLVMGKGIIISLLSVFLFLPGVTVYTCKALEKSAHRTFQTRSSRLSRFLYKGRKIIPVIALLIVVPLAYFSYQNTFTYGNEASQGGEGSEYQLSKAAIEEIFGTQNTIAVILPKEYDDGALAAALGDIENVTSVQSASLLNESGYAEILPDYFLSQFTGESYHRIVLNIDCPEEGAETDLALENIISALDDGGAQGYYLLGNSPAAAETREITSGDYNIISLIAIVLVGVVLLFTYRNPLLPIILLVVIEGSIWVNMAFPYFLGQQTVFLGYMIICNILLGSTIDYAILMTSNYIEARRILDKKEALTSAVNRSLRALLTSAGIFTFGGAAVGLFMSQPTVRSLGMSIMRGGISAFVLVVFVLPCLLVLADRFIKPLRFRNAKIKKRNDDLKTT